MVKTIKKRHSISEVEGSGNSIPPQIFQKILEKHHQKLVPEGSSNENTAGSSIPTSTKPLSSSNKLNDIAELVESSASSTATTPTAVSPQQYNELSIKDTSSSANQQSESSSANSCSTRQSVPAQSTTVTIASSSASNGPTGSKGVYLSTFMSAAMQQPSNVGNHQVLGESSTHTDREEQVGPEIVMVMQQVKSTKSIIKQTNLNGDQQQLEDMDSINRRVNFDPHALLLDAAVEGELDLVIKCAKQVLYLVFYLYNYQPFNYIKNSNS
jgi:hypothetical protein